MSYDLYMKPGSGGITREAFLAYFKARPHYLIEKDQAFYHNEDTDVYFCFDWFDDAAPAAGEEAEGPDYPLAFNINYCRPSYFINEAEPEVSQFIQAFKLLVDDPQCGSGGLEEFDAREFAESWVEGNAGSYRLVAEQQMDVHTLPQAEQARLWEWNHKIEQTYKNLGTDTFVPRIMLAVWQGRLVRFVVWTDGIPTLIPEVDVIACVRNELAPKKLLARRAPDISVMEWRDALPLLEQHKNRMFAGAYDMTYVNTPDAIVQAFRKLTPFKTGFEGVSLSQVLDRELLEAAKG